MSMHFTKHLGSVSRNCGDCSFCVPSNASRLINYAPSVPFQEGANINKSLTTLGKVISALAEVVRVLSLLYTDLCLYGNLSNLVRLSINTILSICYFSRTQHQIRYTISITYSISVMRKYLGKWY